MEQFGHVKIFFSDSSFYGFIRSGDYQSFSMADWGLSDFASDDTLFIGGEIVEYRGDMEIIIEHPSQIGRNKEPVEVPSPTRGGVAGGGSSAPSTGTMESPPPVLETKIHVGNPPSKDLPLKGTLASIQSLVVVDFGNSRAAGKASKLTANIVRKATGGPMITHVNQGVGPDMNKAFAEANRAIQVKYQAWPQNASLSLGFENKYNGKDGPSAAVAYALVLESLIQGRAIDAKVAVTGDMNADQSVQPIGGVGAKVRGAVNAGCELVMIPAENFDELTDLALDGEFDLFSKIQVFTIESLDQALQLAFEERDEKASRALSDFQVVSRAINRFGLKNLPQDDLLMRLRTVGQAMPNHASARILAMETTNLLPKNYTLYGSFSRIEQAISPFLDAIDSESFSMSYKGLNAIDPWTESGRNLDKIRNRIEPGLTAYLDSIRDFLVAGQKLVRTRNVIEDDPVFRSFKDASRAVKSERDRLKDHPKIRDQMIE